MSNRKVNPDSLRQVTRYINEYSQHIWDNELTGVKEFVRVKENNKLKTVRSRSKDGKYYYPYASYEGGAKTIGPGFKLNDISDFTKSVKLKGKATRKQIDAELNRRMAKAYNDVRDIYSEKYGIDDFNTLPQPIVNLMSNLAYRVGRTGFRQYKKLLKGANERNTDSIIKEYTTGNKRRDKSELEIFKNNSSNDYDMIRNRLFSNFNTDDNLDNYVEDMSKTNRKKYNFGGVRSTHDATADYLGMARNSDNSIFRNAMINMFYHDGKNDDTGIPVKNYVDKLITNDKLIYANMQNKINNEIVTARGVARCGGLVRRKRKDFGGVMSGNVYRSIVAGKNNRDYFDGEGVGLKTKYLDDAYLAHLPQVRVVHGRGTGALRAACHKRLKKLNYVKEFRLGEYGEGDTGVTIVVFK